MDVPPNSLQVPSEPLDVAVGDLSSNGLMDIAVIARGNPSSEDDRFIVLEADGIGGFIEAENDSIPTSAGRLRLGDLDGDNDLDVVISAIDVVQMRNEGAFFAFAPIVTSGLTSDSERVDSFIADIDGDGIKDVGYTDSSGHSWVRGGLMNGDWMPGERTSLPGADDGGSGLALVRVGREREGDLDIIGFNRHTANAHLISNLGRGEFESDETVAVCTSEFDGARHGVVADFNDDGLPDIVVSCMDGDGAVTLGTERGFADPVALPLAGAFRPFVADVDDDGDMDVLLTSRSLERAVIFLNDGKGAFSLSEIQFTAPGPVWAAVADDINGDGVMDVVVVSSPDGPGRVDVYTANP